MALNGTFYGSTSNEYIQPKIVWKATQSITGNYSTVTATLYYSRTNSGYGTYGTGTFGITINGSTETVTKEITIGYNSNTLAVSHSVKVNHNDDGSKQITISGTGSISGTTFTSTTISSTVTLDTIPRATQPSVNLTTQAMGSDIVISMPRASGSFSHTLSYAFNGRTGTIAEGVGTSYTWNITMNLANEIPNATSGICTIVCITYNGTKEVGRKTTQFTATVSSSVVPVINSVTLSETVTGLNAKFSAYVQGKSKIKAVINASGIRNSTIKNITTTFDGLSFTGNTFTTGAVSNSGTVNMVTTVTDSRGRTATKTTAVTVLPYAEPTINDLVAYRSNSDGTENYEGTYLHIDYDFDISPCNNLNDKSYSLEYRLKSATDWTILASGSIYTTDSQITSETAILNADNAYEMRLVLTDYFGSTTAILEVPTAFTLIDFNASGKGLSIGSVSQGDTFNVSILSTLKQQDKQTPELLNGWTDYNADTYEPCGYFKDSCGVVHLSGMVAGGTTTAGTGLFTLPVGYRPSKVEIFLCITSGGTGSIRVNTDGAVVLRSGANATWTSLSGIAFKAL